MKEELLKKYIEQANYIVFFSGAGVSTASGIPDFRSKDGLYSQKYDYPPETILSHSFFVNHTKDFYKFYKEKMNSLDAKPNVLHNYLTDLEQQGKLKAIITQNIDGLHTKAGCKCVYELHGSILRNYCSNCHKFYDAEEIFKSDNIPYCECGGIIKPDVVLYQENLNEDVLQSSIKHIASCDLLIVAGTSLTVYPAAGLINYFEGEHLVIINRDETTYDNKADLVINNSLSDVFTYFKK